jgi:hypothetical protein
MVLDESKDHTVRADRKGKSGHAAPGDTVYLYFGMRTKWCRKLGEAKCIRTVPITIFADGRILLNGVWLSLKERDEFAWKDGFRPDGTTVADPGRAADFMMSFWRKTHDQFAFTGTVIYWSHFRPHTHTPTVQKINS